METLEYRQKIINLYNESDIDNIENGLSWYENAYNIADTISKEYGISLNKVIGIMSALSPNNKWSRNIIDTRLFLDNPSLDTKVCTFKVQRQKALDIYNSDGKISTILDILKGVKTKNFFNNILCHNTSKNVTVDIWAFRSLELEPKTKNINLATKVYSEVAKELKLLPHQLQAIIWGVIRGSLV